MNTRTGLVLKLLTAAAICFCNTEALATPKAAEHEDAPVTTGTQVARPKLSAKPVKQQVAGKSRPAAKGKPVNTVRHPKKPKAVQGKK